MISVTHFDRKNKDYKSPAAVRRARLRAATRRHVRRRRVHTIATFQGGLVQVKRRSFARGKQKSSKGSVRGRIQKFSPRSRTRLISKMAALRKDVMDYNPLFLTLTYPAEYPDTMTTKKHLEAFIKRLKRRYRFSGFWRLEFQKRGAPHYHLILFGLKSIPHEIIRRFWGQVIGHVGTVFIRIESVRSRRGVMSYVSKYMSKTSKPFVDPETGILDYVPYHAVDNFPGRFWGVINADLMPYAESYTIYFRGPHSVFYNFRRAAKRFWGGLSTTNAFKGFTLFVGDCDRWEDLFHRLQFEGLRG